MLSSEGTESIIVSKYMSLDEKSEYMLNFKDRRNTLKIEGAEFVKVYTWSEGNYKKEIDSINEWNTNEITEIAIPIKIVANAIPETIEEHTHTLGFPHAAHALSPS